MKNPLRIAPRVDVIFDVVPFARETMPESTVCNFRAEVWFVSRVFVCFRLTLFCSNVCWGET